MAKKKIPRKQLLKEPDEFLTVSRRMFLYVMEHQNQVAGAIGGLLAIMAVIAGIRYFSSQSENRAYARLGQTMEKYETAIKDNAKEPKKVYTEVQGEFQKFLDEYPGSGAAKFAKAAYADICYAAGESDKAIALYGEASAAFSDPSLKNIVLSGLGYAYEQKKEYSAAVAYFEQITRGENAMMKDEAYFNLGRLYQQLGDKEKSRDAYKKLISDYADSMYIEVAKERVSG